MKYLLVLAIVSIFMAIALNPTIEEKVDVQLEQSEALHDSAIANCYKKYTIKMIH
jgi:diacylglycerol kinase